MWLLFKQILSFIGSAVAAILLVLLLIGLGFLSYTIGIGLAALAAIVCLTLLFWSGVIEHFSSKKKPDD